MIREKQFPRRLRTRCFSGLPEDDWFRFAAGETSPGAAKPAVPAQLGGQPRGPTKAAVLALLRARCPAALAKKAKSLRNNPTGGCGSLFCRVGRLHHPR